MYRIGMRNDFYDTPAPEDSVRIRQLVLPSGNHEPARTNYFSVVWVRCGHGNLAIDDMHLPFAASQLFFMTPYQYLRLEASAETQITVLDFHANFLCVETFHHEVGCSGVLFNDPYSPPKIQLTSDDESTVASHYAAIHDELMRRDLAYLEAALARLKLLIIFASRCKKSVASPVEHSNEGRSSSLPSILEEFSDLVEKYYTQWHAPGEYAAALNVTPKTLARMTRQYLGTTPTDLIRRRLLVHAKWQLLHTLKPVKDVAREVGFHDELYFSRLFRKSVGVSPTYFRTFETKIREGRNMSMPLE